MGEAAQLTWDAEEGLYDAGFLSSRNTSWPALWQNVLDLAAYSQVTQCTLLFCLLKCGPRRVVNVFESSSLCGFMPQEGCMLLRDGQSPPLLYRVYNQVDIERRGKYLEERYAPPVPQGDYLS